MSQSPIAVVGAGVIGLACAYYLRRDGHEVVVIERRRAGSGASEGNAGWIVPSLSEPLPGPGRVGFALRSLADRESPLHLSIRAMPSLGRWLFAFARHCTSREQLAGMHATARFATSTMQLFDALAADGVEFEMSSRGIMFAFLDETAARAQLDELAPMRQYGYRFAAEPLATTEARDIEPALGERVRAGILIDGERDVDPVTLVRGLAERLDAMGCRLYMGQAVDGFATAGANVVAVRSGADEVPVSGVVLAAGATTGRLSRQLRRRLPVQAGKGYSVTVDIQPRPSRPVYLGEAMVGCTPMNGHLRLAGTMELSGTRETFDRRRIRAMTSAASRYLAGEYRSITDEWVGMRPITPDGLPIVSRLTPWTNAYVATGHAMLGVTLAPATGAAVARLVRGESPAEVAPFNADRFR